MLPVRINSGGIIDWPLLNQMLSEDPNRIALIPDDESAKRHIPESRSLVIPWQEEDIIYICSRQIARQYIDGCKERLDALKGWANGKTPQQEKMEHSD